MSLLFGSLADEKIPPSPSSPLENVLSEFCQLVTVNPTFLRHQLLRSAALQWNGRTLRGAQRIVHYLHQKQRVGALRGVTFEHPTACAPFDQRETTNQSGGDGAQPNSQEAMLELRAAQGKKRTAAMTAGNDKYGEGQAHSEPEEDGHGLLSSAPALSPDPGESLEDGFRTPPRAFVVTMPLAPASYQALHIDAKGEKSPSSCDSSRTTSDDDVEFTSQQVHKEAIEKPRPIDESSPGSGTVFTALGAGAATSATFGELQYLRATSSTTFSPTGASSPTHRYRNSLVAATTLPDPPTLGLSYRIHRVSRRPHFDRIVFSWSTPYAGRSAVRRKLFETKPKDEQDEAAAESETQTALVSGRPAPPQRANDNVELHSLRRSSPPSPRPVRYPNPPGTPVKRRRNISMLHRTPSAVAGSTTSPTSSSSSYDYGCVQRQQLRSTTPPSAPPTSAAVTNVSVANPNIPFLFGHTGASGSGANLIRLDSSTPLFTYVQGEASRKPTAGAVATTPAAPVRKPLRF